MRWLALLLPVAVPLALGWARRQQRHILRHGRPLSSDEQRLARALGVDQPERVRVLMRRRWPWPLSWFGRHVDAMTLGHAIHGVGQGLSQRLLAHELRHVQQAEAAGSLPAFIAQYLREVARHGYWHAPMEVDARQAAQRYSDVAGRPS